MISAEWNMNGIKTQQHHAANMCREQQDSAKTRTEVITQGALSRSGREWAGHSFSDAGPTDRIQIRAVHNDRVYMRP